MEVVLLGVRGSGNAYGRKTGTVAVEVRILIRVTSVQIGPVGSHLIRKSAQDDNYCELKC